MGQNQGLDGTKSGSSNLCPKLIPLSGAKMLKAPVGDHLGRNCTLEGFYEGLYAGGLAFLYYSTQDS